MIVRRIGSTLAPVLLLAAFLSGASLEAQVFTPTYLSPRPGSDLGVYLSDGPGEFGIEGIWRSGFGAFDLGFRGGLANTADTSLLLGLDYRNPIAVGAPLALAATGGAQAAFGDVSGAGILAGLSLGATIDSPGVSFTPYAHPRVGLIRGLGRAEWDLELLGDIGFDLRFSRMDLRFGATFDHLGAGWGVGVAWR